MSKQRGKEFESEVSTYCDLYRARGLALVQRLEEPKAMTSFGRMVVIGSMPFDFMGIINPKLPIAFECKTKKSANKDTVKFKIVTYQEKILARKKKRGNPPGIQEHQMDGISDWIKCGGMGFILFQVRQEGKKAGFGVYYGLLAGKDFIKIYSEFKSGRRDSISFNECSVFMNSSDYLKYLPGLTIWRGGEYVKWQK